MKSQWECLLQNLGEWEGLFTRFSPQGELIEDTPTVVSLQGLNNNQTIRQIIRRLPPNQPPEEKVLEYSSLGRQVLFFENGAFSQGSIQLSPYSEFGAELGLIYENCRLRLVQLFNSSGQLAQISLIREKLAGTTAGESSPLMVEALVGEWEGEAVTLHVEEHSSNTYPTKLQIVKNSDTQLTQQLTLPDYQTSSTARIAGSIIYFETNQVLLLPDGASATSPQQVKVGQPFFLEVGWLLEPNLRQRLIRRYNARGEWSSLTLVTERRVSSS